MSTHQFLIAVKIWLLLAQWLLAQRSQNFYVDGGCSREVAVTIVREAETQRRDLSLAWFGDELPNWSEPCPITVKSLTGTGGGATSLAFDGGRSYGPGGMSVLGSPENLLANVVPHEVMHTVIADHIGQPLFRWLDEGLCTWIESDTEHQRQRERLIMCLKSGRGIPFSAMFTAREYPADVLAFYAQAFSAVDYLMQLGDGPTLIAFMRDGLQRGHAQALDRYGFASLGDFQTRWLEWVKQGFPRLSTASYGGGYICTPQGCYPQRGIIQPSPRRQAPQTVDVYPRLPNVVPVQPPAQRPQPQPQLPAQPVAPACQCDNAAIAARLDKLELLGPKLDALAVQIANVKACECGPQLPPPVTPQAVEHVVVIADKSSRDWPRLSGFIDVAKQHFSGLRVSDLPPFPIGVIPQAVVYREGVPVKTVKGRGPVERLLDDLRREKAPTL